MDGISGFIIELDRERDGLHDRVVDQDVERGAAGIRRVEAEPVAGLLLGGLEGLLLELHGGPFIDTGLALAVSRPRYGQRGADLDVDQLPERQDSAARGIGGETEAAGI